ncbi:MAG: DUF4493 domain-containing protein [Rikenellaceae bacterium]
MRLQLHKIATMVVIAAMALSSCSTETTEFDSSDDVVVDKDEILDLESYGYVNLAGITFSVDVEDESFNDETVSEISSSATRSATRSDETTDETTDEAADEAADPADGYFVTITNEDSGEVVFNDTFAVAKTSELLTLKAGYYTLYVCSHSEIPSTAWGQKIYASEEKRLTVGDEAVTEIGSVTCRLATIKTQVAISADMREVFDVDSTETPFTVTLTYGTAEMVYTNDKLYDSTASTEVNEANTGYFAPQDGMEKINITMRGLYNSANANEDPVYQEIEWSQTITGVASGQSRMITIRVDNSESSKVLISFEVQKWSYEETLGVNIFSTSFGLAMAEDTIADPDDEETFESDKNAPVLALSSGSVTDVYQISSSTVDEDSETYSPLYKATLTPQSDSSISLIQVIVSSTNTGLTDSVVAMGYTDLYVPIFNNGVVTSSMSSYITAKEDSSTGAVTLTAKYAGISALYKYAGTHTLKVMATDSEGRTSYTDLAIESAGSAGSGPAPTLTWATGEFGVLTDITNASSMTLVLEVESAAGIDSMVLDIDSDVLVASELEAVGLSTTMDVANPTESVEEGLSTLGIPVGSQVKGQTSLSIDISIFIPMLAGISFDGDAAYTTFNVTVTDANGEVSRSIMLVCYYENEVVVDQVEE